MQLRPLKTKQILRVVRPDAPTSMNEDTGTRASIGAVKMIITQWESNLKLKNRGSIGNQDTFFNNMDFDFILICDAEMKICRRRQAMR